MQFNTSYFQKHVDTIKVNSIHFILFFYIFNRKISIICFKFVDDHRFKYT